LTRTTVLETAHSNAAPRVTAENPDQHPQIVDNYSGGYDLAATPTQPVGGIVIPVDKFGLLAPYIALAVAVVAITIGAVYARKRWLGKAVVHGS